MSSRLDVAPESNWDELQASLATSLVVVFGVATWHAYLLVASQPSGDFLLVGLASLGFFLALAARLWLPESWRVPAEVLCFFGVVTGARYLLGYESAANLYPVVAVYACVTFHPVPALFLSVTTVVLAGSQPSMSGEARQEQIVLWLLVLPVLLVRAHQLRGALRQAWTEADYASLLAQEVRVRQQQVNQLNKDLNQANSLLKRSLSELSSAHREADEARRLKEQFATTVSHELRTPLNVILGFLEVMQFYPEVYEGVNWTPGLRRDIRDMADSARYLSRLVDDILDLSRIQALKMPVRRELTDLCSLIEEAVRIAGRLLLENPAVALHVDLPHDLPRLHVDPLRIQQVVLNLLANACRFTDSGEIRVSARLTRDEVIVSVSDTGPGIPADKLETVFGEYEQLEGTPGQIRRLSSKGLGLVIARHFVVLHGGRIWAESEVGKGSKFSFSLPLVSKQVAQLKPVSPHGASDGGPAPCVVVVGDEQAQGLLSRGLEGYRVLGAPDLTAACRLVREEHPDGVIVDVPPDADDSGAAGSSCLDLEPVPVIRCSLSGGGWLHESELFDRWLVKPITAKRLLAVMKQFPAARRVLIVDDDVAFVRLVRRLLEAQGERYQLSWAYDGEQALARLREDRPDVVLMDIAMPRLGGRAVASLMKSNPDVPPPVLVAVTALQPGAETMTGLPQSFFLTFRPGLGEDPLLSLIRCCLQEVRPQYPLVEPLSEPGAVAGERPA
ncbi:MAG: ATP-binding protein [Anaerolineae bacterium]